MRWILIVLLLSGCSRLITDEGLKVRHHITVTSSSDGGCQIVFEAEGHDMDAGDVLSIEAPMKQ